MGAAGLQRPRVAVLGPAETVTPELPETVRAADWVERMRSELGGEAAVEGPLPFDLAALGPARLGMDFHSDVAGEADILLVHTLEEGNIIAKTLIQFAGAVFMGVIAGARVPISLVSRSDTMLNKMASVALAAVLAHHQKSELDVAPTEGDR
jgi:phosphotransacetylase